MHVAVIHDVFKGSPDICCIIVTQNCTKQLILYHL
jgi:hypothetical protein